MTSTMSLAERMRSRIAGEIVPAMLVQRLSLPAPRSRSLGRLIRGHRTTARHGGVDQQHGKILSNVRPGKGLFKNLALHRIPAGEEMRPIPALLVFVIGLDLCRREMARL